ncbi:hypothetical protein AGMMS49556_06140 [Endomicrobiia bacterium]|nr:hypothetical protein AGMMS49556_06140 [Endomicrobiia bacterium]
MLPYLCFLVSDVFLRQDRAGVVIKWREAEIQGNGGKRAKTDKEIYSDCQRERWKQIEELIV